MTPKEGTNTRMQPETLFERREMNEQAVEFRGGVFSRTLLLYGLYTLLSNAFFLIGYDLLPEGFMRTSPQAATGKIAASPETFWAEFALTLLFNIGFTATLAVMLNFNRIKGVPVRYIVPVYLGIVNGLVIGTNSFLESDLSEYDAREGLALGLTIGGLETLGFVLIVAATVRFGVYQYRSWWRWGGKYKPTKTMRLRDVRLSKAEVICLVLGVLLLILGAYRETAMVMGS
jgi:hypothetical protein